MNAAAKIKAANEKRAREAKEKWEAKKDEILWLYNVQKMSLTKIAAYYKTHLRAIQRAFRRLGIPIQPKTVSGAEHPQFKDGKSSVIYRTVITKDKCRKCGTTDGLGIHHKNDDHYDNRLENLEVLCNSCHMSETKRKWWAAKKAGLPTPKSNAPTGWKRKVKSTA